MAEQDPATLPKEQLLLKLLKMTTVQEDTVALVAIRKANELLASAGWDWDKLISGKIKVVENPFKNMPNPTSARAVPTPPPPSDWVTPSRPRRPSRASRPIHDPGIGRIWDYNQLNDTWDSVPDPWYSPARAGARGHGLTRGNNYANHCYCCGLYVGVQNGFIFKPYDLRPSIGNTVVTTKWQTMCDDCNKTGNFIGSKPAMKQTGQTTAPAPNLGNL